MRIENQHTIETSPTKEVTKKGPQPTRSCLIARSINLAKHMAKRMADWLNLISMNPTMWVPIVGWLDSELGKLWFVDVCGT